MPTTKGPDSPEATMQATVKVLDRLAAVLERLSTSHDGNGAAEIRKVLEAHETTERSQAHTLRTIADRLASFEQPVHRGQQLTIEQQQLALSYEALRTTLGRPRAASIAPMTYEEKSRTITVAGTPPDGSPLTLVAIDKRGVELTHRQLDAYNQVQLPGDIDVLDVVRVEIRQAGRPILLGLLERTPSAPAVVIK